MKHKITITPSTYKGWQLSYQERSQDNPFAATHPDKPRIGVYAGSLDGLVRAIDKRDDGLCRLNEPIPVSLKSTSMMGSDRRVNAEIFAYDEACFYLRNEKGEVLTEFLSNLKNRNSISVRLRNDDYPEALKQAVKADEAMRKAHEKQRAARERFVEVTVEAIKTAPFTKETNDYSDE